MQRQLIKKVVSLRKGLHNIAERSGEETKNEGIFNGFFS